MTILLHLADRVLNQPLMIDRGKATVIMDVLAGRIGVGPMEASRFEGSDVGRAGDGSPQRLPYRVTGAGVGIITITGTLVSRGAWIGADSGLTSYEGVQYQLKTALADNTARSIVIDMHSPGGEVIGAFETAALVRELSARKRTVAIVNGMAASAGYAIVSGASEIVTTETGISGSIGVLLLHLDHSRMLDKGGIVPTLIFAGARKVDANPFQPLAEDARKEIQDRVNSVQDLFVAAVATGRGARLTAAKARATEGRTFMGAEAVGVGLADRVGTFETVLAELSKPGASPALPPPLPAAALAAPRPLAAAVPVDSVQAARRAEYDASAALRTLWPDFKAYSAFLAGAEAVAMAKRGS